MSDFFTASLASVDPPERDIAEAGEFWRKAIPTSDPKGRIVRGGMWPHQQEWWDLKNFVKAFVGGYGAGKTLAISKRMMALCLQNAPCPVALVSPTFSIARRTTISTLAELCEGKRSLFGRRFWWRWNPSINEFKIRYRGRTGTIIIYSGDNPNSLRGPNLAAAGIDEPFIQDEEVFQQMVARVRHPDATHLEISITGTPEQLNWGYRLCVGHEDYEDMDVGVVHASTRANLALRGSYVERLEGTLSKKAADAYVGGRFVNLAEGMVYYSFDPRENVVDLPRPSGAELGAGMDFNVNPMAATVFWTQGQGDERHIHFTDEILFPNSDTEYMSGHLREKYWDEGLREIYPDATGTRRQSSSKGRSDFHYIRRRGFHINTDFTEKGHPRNPERRDRYNSVNGQLRATHGRVRLTISPRCKRLIEYLSVYSHELLNKQEDLSHLLDAFSYPVAYLCPVDKPFIGTAKVTGH